MTAGPLLILGRHGQVARELRRLCDEQRRPCEAAGRERLNLLTDFEPAALLDAVGPRAVVNASGYTGVERAEAEPDAAFRMNRDAPAALARACAERGLPFVHYSSDYVFDGAKGAPYVETDERRPLNVYGRSKAEGEDGVAGAGGRWAVLRTSWVYSAFGANFVKTMLARAEAGAPARVVDDQCGRPTWARDAAEAALRAVDRLTAGDAVGLLHVAGAGDASWARFAASVFEQSAARGGPAVPVEPVSTAAFGATVPRPADSRLDDAAFRRRFGWGPPPWPESLGRCLDELLEDRSRGG